MNSRNLAALSNSIFSSLQVTGAVNELGIAENPGARECLLLIDGMGADLISKYGRISNLQRVKFINKPRFTFPINYSNKSLFARNRNPAWCARNVGIYGSSSTKWRARTLVKFT
jgi:hypothetical protein